MNPSARIIALLMSIAVLISSFIACGKDENTIIDDSIDNSDVLKDDPVTEADETEDDAQEKEDDAQEKEDVFEIVYPSVSVSSLKFELTDKDLEEYKGKLMETKRLFNKSEGVSEDEFRGALYELLSLEAAMQTQRDIAYIQYHYDMSDSVAWDHYLYAYNLHDDANDLFWAFYNESKKSDSHLLAVFKQVVQKEFKGNLVSTVPSADSYADEMTALEGEYNSLKNSGASDEKMFNVYKEYMVAAYGYATSSNTANYYEYANKYIYYRNDTSVQRKALRQYVKEYLVPLYRQLRDKSKAYDSQLALVEYALSNEYVYGEYNSFGENYLIDYFSSLPSTSCAAMTGAFEKDRVLIGDRDNSYNSAMVHTVGNTPICYFHQSKTTLDTMAHEIGHYYAHIIADRTYCSLDLRETHSTANTMLLYSYLSDKLDTKAFTSAEIYMVSNWLYQTISSVIKDEFDEMIYARDPSTLTLEDFESIMGQLIDKYDVRDLSNNIGNQLMTYWRRLGIIYPMSNYCYATAMISALQIYIISKDNYFAASEMYKTIVEDVGDQEDFLLTIVTAGLTTPYDEQTYIKLNELKNLY